MTAAKRITIKEYCNSLYDELDGMKSTLNGFIDQIEHFQGADKEHVGSHANHLLEIIKNIDWKLQIVAKDCPLERFSEGAEDTASVPLEEPAERAKRAGGGSIGG